MVYPSKGEKIYIYISIEYVYMNYITMLYGDIAALKRQSEHTFESCCINCASFVGC